MIYVNINNIFVIEFKLCCRNFEDNYPNFSQYEIQRAVKRNKRL
jgi:hypothetical protein